MSHAELGGGLRTVTDSLHRQFDDRLGPETVTSEIQFVADRFAGAPIRAFVPLLVRRYATEELTHRLTWP